MDYINLCGTIYCHHGYRKCPQCGYVEGCYCGKSPEEHKEIRKQLRRRHGPLSHIERTNSKYE
jgi:hypothetical protein